MAGAILLPSAPNTGLGQLGDVLMQTGRDIAQNTRYDARRAEQRQQQLADVDSARGYVDRTNAANRTNKLSDEKTANEVAVKHELIRIGFLAPDKLYAPTDDPAVMAAAAEFDKSNMAQRYAEAIKSGDLTYADLGDKTKVDAGLAKFAERIGEETKFKTDQRGRASSVSDKLANEARELVAQANELDQKLSSAPPAPTQQQVATYAEQIVRANGQPVNDKNIAAAMADAQEELNSRALQAWAQQKNQWIIQRQLLESRLRDNASRQNTTTNRFGTVGLADPVAPEATAPAARAPSLEEAQRSFADQVTARLAQSRGASPAAAAAPALSADPYANLQQRVSTQNDAARVRQNEVLTRQNETLREPFIQSEDKLDTLKRRLKAVQAGLNPAAAEPITTNIGSGQLTLTPEEQAQWMTQLNQEIAAEQTANQKARAFMFQKSGVPAAASGVSMPVLSTPTGTAPLTPNIAGEWWNP